MRLPFGLEVGRLTCDSDCRSGWGLFTDGCRGWRHRWRRRLRRLTPSRRKPRTPNLGPIPSVLPDMMGSLYEITPDGVPFLNMARLRETVPAADLPQAIFETISAYEQKLRSSAAGRTPHQEQDEEDEHNERT